MRRFVIRRIISFIGVESRVRVVIDEVDTCIRDASSGGESRSACGGFTPKLLTVTNVMRLEELRVQENFAGLETMLATADDARGRRRAGLQGEDGGLVKRVYRTSVSIVWGNLNLVDFARQRVQGVVGTQCGQVRSIIVRISLNGVDTSRTRGLEARSALRRGISVTRQNGSSRSCHRSGCRDA